MGDLWASRANENIKDVSVNQSIANKKKEIQTNNLRKQRKYNLQTNTKYHELLSRVFSYEVSTPSISSSSIDIVYEDDWQLVSRYGCLS